MDSLIQTILVSALPLLFAITLHETAHGMVAKHFGDNTAYAAGRISLNPMRHIDPIGTLAIPLVMLFATGGALAFGYAKPVPVNFGQLRNPRWDSLWVALAGPACNLLQALVWACAALALRGLGVDEAFFVRMASAGVAVNLVLCALNLFPLLPLDGGRVLAALLPVRIAYRFSKIEPYGFFIVMALVMTRWLDTLWLRPLVRFGYEAIFGVLRFFVSLFS